MYDVTSVQNLPFKSYEGRPKPADAPKTHKQGKIHRHRHVGGAISTHHRCDYSGDGRRHNTVKLVGFVSKKTNWREDVHKWYYFWYWSIASQNMGPPHTYSPWNLGPGAILTRKGPHWQSWHTTQSNFSRNRFLFLLTNWVPPLMVEEI
jgi:hypothetical protein